MSSPKFVTPHDGGKKHCRNNSGSSSSSSGSSSSSSNVEVLCASSREWTSDQTVQLLTSVGRYIKPGRSTFSFCFDWDVFRQEHRQAGGALACFTAAELQQKGEELNPNEDAVIHPASKRHKHNKIKIES